MMVALQVVQLRQPAVRADCRCAFRGPQGPGIRLRRRVTAVTRPAGWRDGGAAISSSRQADGRDASSRLALELGGRRRQPPFLGHVPIRLQRLLGPELLSGEQDHAVHDQEHGSEYRLAEQHAEGVLEQQPGESDRDGGHDDHPGELLVGGGDVTVPDRAEEPANDPDPVAPEVDQQRDRGGDVQADNESQVGRLRLCDVQITSPAPADERRDQDVVAQARDREKLGNALDQADHHRLGVRHHRNVRHESLSLRRAGSRL